MSRTIDERVVEMRFDNKEFERNVHTSLSTLDKLKEKLNLTGASKGLDEVNKAASKVDLNPLSHGVETVGLKFNALYTIADHALRRITDRAMDAGERLVKSLTIDPIKTGFSEYETKINSIQTIMSNTASKGTTMEDVTKVIGELNTYADKTIYNFAEMTRNIGTFTAAGIGLEESASAIQGIANLAAVSGSTSQQASTAMYQLSQAMASGTVKLMDWNSVVNAGMGGQVFQDALKATAKAHGVAVDEIIEKNGSFRESLSEGWITSEILTETLSKMTKSGAAEYLSKLTGVQESQITAAQKLVAENKDGTASYEDMAKQLAATGKITKDEALNILKMADNAEDAATKVKTFTQLFDTLKESAQSGWSQTWEILVGDFEEAKEMLTKVSDTIGGIIGASADARNELLTEWKNLGGREDILNSFVNIFESIKSIVIPIKEAFGEIFPPTTAEQLKAITASILKFTSNLKLSEVASDNLKRTFRGVFSIVSIAKEAISAILKVIGRLIGKTGSLAGGILNVLGTFGDWITNLDTLIKTSGIFDQVLQDIINVIAKIISFVSKVLKTIKDIFIAPGLVILLKQLTKLKGIIEAVGGLFVWLKNGVVAAFNAISDALENCTLFKLIKILWNGISLLIKGIAKAVTSLVKGISSTAGSKGITNIFDIIQEILSGGLIIALMGFVKNMSAPFSGLKDVFDGLSKTFSSVVGVLDSVRGCFEAYQTKLKADVLFKIAGAIAILVASLLVLSSINSEDLTIAIGAITALFAELLVATSLVGKIKSPRGMLKLSAALIALSSSILILSIATKIMSSMTFEELALGLTGITVGLGALVIAINLLPDRKVKAAATAIKRLSTALLILSLAIKIMSSMSFQEMAIGLTTMVISLMAMVAAVRLLPKNLVTRVLGITTFATAIVILAGALKILGSMSWNEMTVGLIGLAGSMAVLVVSLKLMKRSLSGAAAMLIVAPALLILAGALKKFGNLSLEQIVKGLVALGGSLITLAIGLKVMKSSLSGVAALILVVPALMLLAGVLKILGGMSWGSIAKGLLSIAGAFIIIGVAAKVLAPLIAPIIGLAAAMTLIGVGVLAAGAGLIALGIGLSVISVGLTALASSLGAVVVVIVSTVSALIVGIIKGIGEGIIALCEIIIEGAPKIGEAIKVLIFTCCELLTECIPVIANTILELIVVLLESLVKYIPKIVDLLVGLIVGIVDALIGKLPELIGKFAELVGAIVQCLIDAFSSVDSSVLMDGIITIGLVAILVKLVASTIKSIPKALIGLAGLTLVIAELGLIFAAFGALAQIPGVEWIINEGANFMKMIGEAMLQSIVAFGLASALMIVASALSGLIAPALIGIAGLALIIAEMTAVFALFGGLAQIPGLQWLVEEGGAFIATVTKVLGEIIGSFVGGLIGGVGVGITDSLVVMAQNLSLFMEEIQPFIDGAMGIDPAIVKSIGALAAAVVLLTGADILNSLASFITGGVNFSGFAQDLVLLGEGLKGFSEATQGVDPAVVKNAAEAAKTLVDMTNAIPNSGGLISWFAGDNSIAKFSSEIVTVGHGLKGFSDAIVGIVPANIVAAADAAKALAEMTAIIPNSGGMAAWFSGDNSVARFAMDIVNLGHGLKGFSVAVMGIVPENVIAASNAAKALAEMASVIPNQGGMVAWFTGDNSLSKFSGEIVNLGYGLKGFSVAVMGINPENVMAAANAAKSLAEMASVIPNQGGMAAWFAGDNSISKFSGELASLGAGLRGFSASVAGIVPENVVAAANASKALAEMTAIIPNEGGMKSWFSGESGVVAFADRLPPLGKGLKGFSTSVQGINPENVTAAANAAKALGEMTAVIPKEGGVKAWFTGETSIANFADKLPTLGKGLKKFSESVAGINPENTTAASKAAKNIGDLVKDIPGDPKKLTKFSEKLEDFGKDLKSYFSTMSKISPESLSSSNNALKAVNEVSKIDAGNISAVSKALDKLTESAKKMAKDIKADFKNSGKEAIEAYIKGVKDKLSSAKTAIKDVVSDCAKAASDKATAFTTAGRDVVIGFANGISENTYRAEAKARAMARAAADAAEDELDINSPSKVFRNIAYSIPEGFALGIDKLSGIVGASSASMGDLAIDGVKSSIARLANVINGDMDVQPTIRPVLDLSDVRAGAGSISRMFGSGSSLGVSANINAISSSMNRQNGGNGDVISAIDKLRDDLKNVNNTTYTINGITYDDGSNIAEAVKSIVRAAKVERRI